MIYLSTQTPVFFNDICEVIRLFYGITPIEPAGDTLNVEQGGIIIRHDFSNDAGESWRNTFSLFGPGGKKLAEYEYTFHPLQSVDDMMRKRDLKRCAKTACFRMLKNYTGQSMPWGSLTGIRPTKLLRDISKEGLTPEGAREVLIERFDCSEQKASLVYETAKNQEKILSEIRPGDIDIYIGIPFCTSRCLYCSFASNPLPKDRETVQKYLDALCGEIRAAARSILKNRHIRSVYIGGGTPTALSYEELSQLLETVASVFRPAGAEFTLEAGRPDTLDPAKLKLARTMGVKRIAVNPQSMNEKTLAAIGRAHSPKQVVQAFAWAREEGFSCINMDIIAGLPAETPEDFDSTLKAVLRLRPDNLTVHTLAVKRASRLREQLENYALPVLCEVERMLDTAYASAKAAGMKPYYLYRQKYMMGNLENTGYAFPGKECLYNIDIMEERVDILALGAGAISKRIFAKGRIERHANPKDLKTYMENVERLTIEREGFFGD
ncbi:MAG: coproporphyrinogen dehydrogenase HemZ [Bacillota bacterium]|nr:coproporphyrinogen dehydrogenase HemZ [Bacillota bacterium]